MTDRATFAHCGDTITLAHKLANADQGVVLTRIGA